MVHRRKPNRRVELAAIALRVLAETGLDGLTHRAVDIAANLPIGSINYYAPTRSRLIELVCHELLSQDAAVYDSIFDRPDSRTRSLSDLVELYVHEMAGPDHRHRVVARLYLLAEAQHRADFLAAFEVDRNLLTTHLASCIDPDRSAAGVTEAQLCALLMNAAVQRLVLSAEPNLDVAQLLHSISGVVLS